MKHTPKAARRSRRRTSWFVFLMLCCPPILLVGVPLLLVLFHRCEPTRAQVLDAVEVRSDQGRRNCERGRDGKQTCVSTARTLIRTADGQDYDLPGWYLEGTRLKVRIRRGDWSGVDTVEDVTPAGGLR